MGMSGSIKNQVPDNIRLKNEKLRQASMVKDREKRNFQAHLKRKYETNAIEFQESIASVPNDILS